MISRFILPALAAASGAYAQCTASSGTVTLSSPTDAAAITGCSTYSGSIALATGITGDISLNGIQSITGSVLGASIPNVTSITANTLTTITGNLTLGGATSLNSLAFTALNSVGALSFIALGPQYQATGFTNLTSVPSLEIYNTFLQALTGISITNQASTILIAANTYLTQINILAKQVTSSLTISANANGANVSLPYLTTAGSIDIENVTTLSMPALQNTTAAINLLGNAFTTLSLPNLTQSDGLNINYNNDMTNFTVPMYTTTLADINVQNNTALTGTISFPALTTVDGSADFVGAFSGLYLPKLNTIQGSMEINSTSSSFQGCSTYNALAGNTVHGTVTCKQAAASSSGSSSSGTASSTSSSSSSTATKSGAADIVVPSAASSFTVFGVLAAFFGLLM